ncbi:major tail protein [Loigolactobacillus bifermentans]|uniref:Phage-related major tail protein n=1 Tax=Loigolactobacillus bifermentans DSM 20003 TaxID=1423726 RepID=A0A0R1H2W8_9LACO|nr:major tail protein [Loigolactobacillus bifermentans]KRK40892.1 phage-related major tail protein [Loigolactobacillus bifermentans DSM 20003]QGG59646.1 phage tail protein [Loigolactobacillus bifermentans]
MAGETPTSTPTTQKKIAKFGVSAFEYGVVNDEELCPTSTKVPGLSSVKMDIKAETKTLAADDGPYLILSAGITEATETIENFDVNSQMKKDFYNIRVVGGTEIYPKNLTPNYVTTLFRTKLSNGKYVWVAMLKGMFTLPGIDAKAVDGTPDPNPDSIEGSFIPRGDADTGNVVLIGREDNEGFNLAQFRKWVFPTSAEDAAIPDEVASSSTTGSGTTETPKA